jgi:hypothetical protein
MRGENDRLDMGLPVPRDHCERSNLLPTGFNMLGDDNKEFRQQALEVRHIGRYRSDLPKNTLVLTKPGCYLC